MSRRIRKHANPFNVLTELPRVDQAAAFGREAPMEWDLGCGGGDFLFQRARAVPEHNFVGLEVRKPLVEAANARAAREGLKNLVFYYANANMNLAAQRPGSVLRFSVQFPDPCFKKRHHKRRILQPRLVRQMAELLPMGGEVYVQSDVAPLAEEMLDFLSQEPALARIGGPELTIPAPFEARTEWERQHEREGEPIYRMRFAKVAEPAGPVPEPEFRDVRPEEARQEA